MTLLASYEKTKARVDLRDAVPTLKDLSEVPSVEDTFEVAREDAEANLLTAVTTPEEPGTVVRSRHELTHMPGRCWYITWFAGLGADEPHRKSDGYSRLPRVECDFMLLSSRLNLPSHWLAFFLHD